MFKHLLLLVAALPVVAADRPAPEFSFTVPGKGQQTVSSLIGKVVALSFVYSTCKPCQASAERLDRIASEFRPRGFEAVEIAFDPNASELVDDLAKQQQLSIPLAWASGSNVMQFLGYNLSDRPAVPQIVLLDRTGVIRYQTPPQVAPNPGDDLRSDAALRARIVELLGTPSAPPVAVEHPPRIKRK